MLRRSYYLIAAAIALCILGAIAWWPVHYNEIITRGIDAYRYHGPLFGDHTHSQDLVIEKPVEALSVLLVALRPSAEPPEAIITLTNTESNQLLQTHRIPTNTLIDDTFTTIALSPPLAAPQKVRLTLSAPTATANTALGVRFHPDDVYPTSQRVFDGKPLSGDLALGLTQRLPLWRVIQKNFNKHPAQAAVILQASILSLVAALVASRLGWATAPISRQRWIELSLIGLLGLATILVHIPALKALGGVSGGDPYNYLFITQNIVQLENPWVDKRLPGYPLLLLPAYISPLDDHLWMRFLNVISAGGSVVLLGLLARRLALPWSIQFLAPLLLIGQKDFYWTALRPEPYTVYTFLLMASLFLFFSLTSLPRRILFGFILGYAAMTRQEGFMLAAILTLAAVAHMAWARRHFKSYATAFLPALIVVLPFFINNALLYGNPLYTPYFEGERLDIVDSWNAFTDALGGTWGILGSYTKTNWERLERYSLTSPLFLGSALLTLLWWAYGRWRLTYHTAAEGVALGAVSVTLIVLPIYAFIHNTGLFADTAPATAAALLVSPIALLTTLRWRGLLLLAVALSQIGIATWFHPFTKHYQQSWPLIALGLALLLIMSNPAMIRPRQRFAIGATYVGIIFIFAIAILPLYQPSPFHANIDRSNHATAHDSVVYRAIQAARAFPGPYAVDDDYLAGRLYFDGQAKIYPANENPSSVFETEWLEEHAIQTLVTTNTRGVFTDVSDGWQQTAHFKAEGRDEELFESFVYTRR